MALIPTPNQAPYLTLRAERDDFQRVEEGGREIMDTFATYVNAAAQ